MNLIVILIHYVHIKNSLILIDTLTPRSINDCSRCIHLRCSNDFTTFNISFTPQDPSSGKKREECCDCILFLLLSAGEKEWSECCLQINLICGNQSTGTTDIFILYTKLRHHQHSPPVLITAYLLY